MKFRFVIITFLASCCTLQGIGAGVVMGQGTSDAPETNSNRSSPDAAQIESWISELNSPEFAVRQAATEKLRDAGEAAREQVTRLLKSTDPEVARRAAQIIESLDRNRFSARFERALLTRSVTDAARLPYWNRFRSLVPEDTSGNETELVKSFLQLVQAEQALFEASERSPAELSAAIQSRSETAARTRAAGPGRNEAPTVSVNSIAAMLLIGSDPRVRLPGATSSCLTQLLNAPQYHSAVTNGSSSDLHRLLAGQWILRPRIAPEYPLMFAARHNIPEGRQLARRILEGRLTANRALYALLLLVRQGTPEDLPLLESLFNDQTVLLKDTGPAAEGSAEEYRVEAGDLALAVAASVRGIPAVRLGFPAPTENSPPFSGATTGFNGDAPRQKARALYHELTRP